MPVSKLKNLALLILLLANLALLVLVVPGQTARVREEQNLRQSLHDLCEKQQVHLDPELVPDTVTWQICRTEALNVLTSCWTAQSPCTCCTDMCTILWIKDYSKIFSRLQERRCMKVHPFHVIC